MRSDRSLRTRCRRRRPVHASRPKKRESGSETEAGVERFWSQLRLPRKLAHLWQSLEPLLGVRLQRCHPGGAAVTVNDSRRVILVVLRRAHLAKLDDRRVSCLLAPGTGHPSLPSAAATTRSAVPGRLSQLGGSCSGSAWAQSMNCCMLVPSGTSSGLSRLTRAKSGS